MRALSAVGRAIRVLAPLVFAVPVHASQAQFSSRTGAWKGEVISIRWRESLRTAYRPETVIFVENLTSGTVVVGFSWDSRVCGGTPIPFDSAARSFTYRLFFDRGGIHSTLQPREWDAVMFPRGLPADGEVSREEICVAEIRLKTHSGGSVRDEVELVIPAPLPSRVDGE